MTRLRNDEGGWVLMTAIGLMAIMLSVALATMSYVDTQQRQSGVTRGKETAFNLAEAALNAQIYALSREWPGVGRAAAQYQPCTRTSVSPRCPSEATLGALFTSPDALNGTTWRTTVRDNSSSDGSSNTQSFFSDTTTAASPGYDANDDGRLWVRAEATAQGRKRTVIALVRVDEVFEELPRAAVISGRMRIDNSGNKTMVDATAGGYPAVRVRCAKEDGVCLGHEWGANPMDRWAEQISPPTYEDNYSGGDAASPDARERLRQTAIANGTYYTSCPATPPSGDIVWIDNGNCVWNGTTGANSRAHPGLLIINNGTVYFGGTTYFFGIIYALNPTDSTGTVVNLQGNTEIVGGVLIDGPGNLSIGSSKLNIELDETAWNGARSYTSAGMIQNTWREIKSTP